MVNKIKKLKKIRIHREGTETLVLGFIVLAVVAPLLWVFFECKVAFWTFLVIYGIAYGIIINFFRCPIRVFNGDTEKVVVAPADGKIVVIE